MKWFWNNTTQVAFGAGVVKDYLKQFIKPGSKVLCTFGGGSIEQNGCKADVVKALEDLHCEVQWEGGIPANPEYDRCLEIAAVAKATQPDWILSVGGGSVLDATKFISLVAKLPDGADPMDILVLGAAPTEAFKIGSVMTLPATGSEWNKGFVISRRSMNLKLAGGSPAVFPTFSLLDPLYTMTLPVRQLRNGVYDSVCHIIDQFMTQETNFMFDGFWISCFRELIQIGPLVCQDGSSLELHERLIVAASFALNLIFCLPKPTDWSIHMIGHQLTAKYDIDHGATLAIVTVPLLESQLKARKQLLARTAAETWGVTGTEDEKAAAFITHLREFIAAIGMPSKCSEYPDVHPKPEDVEEVLKMVMDSTHGSPLGIHDEITEDVIRSILQKVVC
jgi:alcohol dehydrogenase YqhD (iron-dependent ADH family)